VELLGHDRVWVTGITSAAVASFARTLGVPDRAATVTASVMSHAPDLASSRVVVVVDANLADVSHVSALVRACPSGTVLLVGDADGLAPVGVGDAFVDLLSSNACVCESARARACDARRLCERVDAGDARGLLRELGGRFVSVTEGTWSRVAIDVHLEEMDEVASSVLMCPYRTHGEIDLLNKRLAERFGLGERVSELADVSYRIGDVVRCARADDSAVVLDEAGEVVDGAVLRGLRGRIEGEDGGVVRIALDDGGVALVHVGTLFGWHHAWAETVHASAVRRWRHVTLVVPPGHVPEKGRPFVSACLLHAAIAAAHGSFSLVADASEVERALSWRGHGRRTHLRDLLGSRLP
jgi:ATP-dependent exoDNAse (exonuclease V) alpha subunit